MLWWLVTTCLSFKIHSVDLGIPQVCDGSGMVVEKQHEHTAQLLQALMMRAQEIRTRYNQTWVLEHVEERI